MRAIAANCRSGSNGGRTPRALVCMYIDTCAQQRGLVCGYFLLEGKTVCMYVMMGGLVCVLLITFGSHLRDRWARPKSKRTPLYRVLRSFYTTIHRRSPQSGPVCSPDVLDGM